MHMLVVNNVANVWSNNAILRLTNLIITPVTVLVANLIILIS